MRAMSKQKLSYSCNECGSISPKWSGQCADCMAWNSLTEMVIGTSSKGSQHSNYSGGKDVKGMISLEDVDFTQQVVISTGLAELDRVFGSGLVPGSISLIGGDPGIGKSTLLLQMISFLSKDYKTLYATGEESAQQVKMRAIRLQLQELNIPIITETNIDDILQIALKAKPMLMVVDSIQTMWTPMIQSAPGSVSQVRESAAELVKFAKQTNTIVILVGHVTKDGAIAGPRVLEHMVDTVLYFEGAKDSKFRMLRAVKNRFGAVNELGIFAMTDRGLKEVNNPSAIFLARNNGNVIGSVIVVTWEGSRPLLIEIQALVDESQLANPRRVTVGFEPNRLALILAVLHRHGNIKSFNQDIFLNVVGGVKINETGIDLAALLAVTSSIKNKALSNDLIVFGEVGLSGEIRPVQSGQERIREAYKLGFKRAIVPQQNLPKNLKDLPIEVIGVNSVMEALEYAFC
jgi:DNA repair protein RadA/Sms